MTQTEDPFDPRNLDLPVHVREIYRDIRTHPKLTADFKIKWMEAIISIFDERILFSEKSMESKKSDAKTCLNDAMKLRTQEDYKQYDTDEENKRILEIFEDWLKRDYLRRNSK